MSTTTTSTTAMEIKNRDRILEAIDLLRKRKARPDFQRICNFLLRRFSISWNETKADLQRCIDHHIVLKVEYKGNISYRNASARGPGNSTHHHLHLVRGDKQRRQGLQQRARKNFAQHLTNAIAELIVHEPDYLELGVPADDLVRAIFRKDRTTYTPNYISHLLAEEVKRGALTRSATGNFLMGPEEGGAAEVQQPQQQQEVQVQQQPAPRGRPPLYAKQEAREGEGRRERKSENGVRVGSRRKRAKKVFDPSDTHIPRKRGRPAGTAKLLAEGNKPLKVTQQQHVVEMRGENGNGSTKELGGVCSVCHNNKKMPYSKLVACKECSNKAHLSCLNGSDMMLKMYPDNTWRCPYCKTCVVCFETSDAGNLIVCTVCADAYHGTCHDPTVTEKQARNTKWICSNCQMPAQLHIEEIHPNVEIVNEGDNEDECDKSLTASFSDDESNTAAGGSAPPSPTPPALSPQTCQNGTKSSSGSPESKSHHLFDPYPNGKEIDIEELVDPSVPDASNWTSMEVYNYFQRYFPKEAAIFKEQEIDGQSLLLMKRMDVVRGLKLKLGPALKIYRHVVKLQFRRDDPKLYWV